MRQTKYWVFFLAVSVASVLVWLLSSLPGASQPTVQLQANPPLNQVVPAVEPVELMLQALDTNRQPLRDVNFQVRLFTPPKTPWFTSDFPIVEGTTLLELNAIAPSGTLRFEQTLPIRGTYRTDLNVTPQTAGAFEPFEQTLTFSIPDNSEKYRNVAVLGAILLLAGVGGGWVIGGNQTTQVGEIAPQPVRMVLSAATVLAIVVLLFVNINAELASSHAEHSSLSTSAPTVQQSQGIRAELSGDTQAVVGKTATQTVRIADATTGQPVSDVALKIQAIALEHNEKMFSYAGVPDQTGQLTWQEQFFDGAPHQVMVNLLPLPGNNRQFPAFQVAREVDVEGVAPPLYIRLISLIYFTAIFVVGLLAGLWLRRRTRPQHS